MDPSEAGVAVLEAQLRSQEPLIHEEQAIVIEASREPSVAEIAARIAEKLNPTPNV
jgi:predicted kinase